MSLKNLIVKGRFFQYSDKKLDLDEMKNFFNRIKSNIQEYLILSGYELSSPPSIFHNYANMEFYPAISKKILEPEKKSFFSNKQEKTNPHLEQLKLMKDSAPWHLNVCYYPGKYNDKDAIFIEITSEPSIVHKYQQLLYRPTLNPDDIALIVYENEEFISRLAIAILLNTLEKPHPIGSFVKTEITEKLRAFNFNKIAELLEKGRNEIEIGKPENGLVDLRSALEIFFVEIIKRRGGTANNQDKMKLNINELKNLGIIDESMAKLLVSVLVTGVYSNLSETTHSRKSLDLFDARLYFNTVEQIFDFLIEKGIKYNINFNN